MHRLWYLLVFVISSNSFAQTGKGDWSISVLPSSIRLDPVRNEIIENRFVVNRNSLPSTLLDENWIFSQGGVSVKSARGEARIKMGELIDASSR